MTPHEKAKELVEKYSKLMNYGSYALPLCEYTAKQCALIAVDEIIKANPIIPLTYMLESEAIDAGIEYWNEVEDEIEKL